MTKPIDPKRALRAYLGVQEDADRQLYRVLARAASDISRQLDTSLTRGLIGDVIRREQLLAAKKAIYEEMAVTMRNVGLVVRAAQLDAAAEAINTFQEYEKRLFRDVGILNDDAIKAHLESARVTSQAGISAVKKRLLGESYVPLADSVYRTTKLANGMVDRAVESALARGLSAKEFADSIKDLIDPNVRGGVSYAAQRLARTEINNAHHAIASEKIRTSPFVKVADWNLSGSHPTPDECNEYAEEVHFEGGQPGQYLPGEIPKKPHPQCLCFVTPGTMEPEDFLDKFFAGGFDDQPWMKDIDAQLVDRDRAAEAAAKPAAPTVDRTAGWKPKMTDAEAKKWTSTSAIQGEMFHGTSYDVSDKVLAGGFKVGSGELSGGAVYGRGVYLTAMPKKAKMYAELNGDYSRVLSTRVNVSSPVSYTDMEKWPDVQETLRKYEAKELKYVEKADALVASAKARGHDAIIVPDPTGKFQNSELLVFDPKQIVTTKSRAASGVKT